MWAAFLAIHVIGLVGFNLMVRRQMLLKADPWAVAAILQTGIAIPMLVALVIARPDWSLFTPRDTVQVVLTAAVGLTYQLANVKALQSLEAGVFSVFFNLRIVFATVLGITFLGEDVIWTQILGGLLILAAVVIVRQNSQRSVTVRGIQWGIAAAVAISILNASEKDLLTRLGYLEYAAPAMLLASVAMWIIVYARGAQVPARTFAQPRTVVLMIFRAASAYGMLAALYFGAKVSVATYVSSLSVIVLVAMGVIILRERDYLARKALASGTAAIGLTLIVLASP